MTLHSTSQVLPSKDATILSAVEALPPQLLSGSGFRTLPQGKVTALLAALDHAVAQHAHPVLHLVSAYSGEGVESIAFETALTAAKSGKRVLFLDANVAGGKGVLKSVGHSLSLEAAVSGRNPAAQSPFWLVEGTSLYAAVLSERGGSAVNPQIFIALLSRLRELYDLIIISSEAALASGVAASFATLTDGTVIVIEAERTRAPVVKELANAIENNGGRILGTVLNKRRYYIPRFLYAMLFGRQK